MPNKTVVRVRPNTENGHRLLTEFEVHILLSQSLEEEGIVLECIYSFPNQTYLAESFHPLKSDGWKRVFDKWKVDEIFVVMDKQEVDPDEDSPFEEE